MSIEEKASLLAAKYSSKYDKSKPTDGSGSKLKREDSTDDLMKSIALAKERRQKRLEELMKVKQNAKNKKCNTNIQRDPPKQLPLYSVIFVEGR